MGEEKKFPFRVVMGAVNELQICSFEEMIGLYEHMVGSPVFDHQMPDICECCERILVKMIRGINIDRPALLREISQVRTDRGLSAAIRLLNQRVAEAQAKFGVDEIAIKEGCAANPAQKLHEMIYGGIDEEEVDHDYG